MVKVEIEIDGDKLYKAIQDADGLPDLLRREASRIAATANASSSGFRTGIFHVHGTDEVRGNTQPQYGSDVSKRGRTVVGLVMPKNYAAMKDNHEHNTLLKSIR